MRSSGIAFDQVRLTLPNGSELLKGISLTLDPGSKTALLGRSGSGKTTLLRTVNALVMPTSGEVRVADRPTSEWDPTALRRSIGYVIQETGLFPHMTIERNVGLAFELAGASATTAQERIEQALTMTGLDPATYRGRYPWQLSGGQRQRAGLARALAIDPAILLMDEPFGALDPITRAEMQTMLRDLIAGSDHTVLIVTHDLDEALFLADRILFVDGGRIGADLPRDDVIDSQAPLVRQYVEAAHRAEMQRNLAARGAGV